MELLEIVYKLEGKSSFDRFNIVTKLLDELEIAFDIHYYATGSNIIVGNTGERFIGIGSHFDVFNGSPGANDNASGVAVILGLIKKISTSNFKQNLVFFFFDQEEQGMLGSKSYIQDHSIHKMQAYINLEMVGIGNKIALWSLNKDSYGEALETMENILIGKEIYAGRFEKLVGRYADHVPFRKAGIEDSFSLTCVSDKDLDVLYHYNKAKEFDVDKEVLDEILSKGPLFKDYHQHSDLAIHLSEESLKLVERVVFETLSRLVS